MWNWFFLNFLNILEMMEKFGKLHCISYIFCEQMWDRVVGRWIYGRICWWRGSCAGPTTHPRLFRCDSISARCDSTSNYYWSKPRHNTSGIVPLPVPFHVPTISANLDAGKRRARCRSMLRHLTIMPSCPSALQVGYQRIMRMLLSIQLVSYFLRVSLTVHLLCRGALLKRKLKRRKIFVMTSQSLIFADVEME